MLDVQSIHLDLNVPFRDAGSLKPALPQPITTFDAQAIAGGERRRAAAISANRLDIIPRVRRVVRPIGQKAERMMSGGLTQVAMIDGAGAPQKLLAGSNMANGLVIGHTFFDINGAPAGMLSNPLFVDAGMDTPGIPVPAGGNGIRGWLSAAVDLLRSILNRLTGTLTVSATALPLPTGAASDTTLVTILNVVRPVKGVVAMVVGTPTTPGLGVRIKCTASGDVSLKYEDGSIDVIPVNAGVTEIMGSITAINSDGTTAVATYSALV